MRSAREFTSRTISSLNPSRTQVRAIRRPEDHVCVRLTIDFAHGDEPPAAFLDHVRVASLVPRPPSRLRKQCGRPGRAVLVSNGPTKKKSLLKSAHCGRTISTEEREVPSPGQGVRGTPPVADRSVDPDRLVDPSNSPNELLTVRRRKEATVRPSARGQSTLPADASRTAASRRSPSTRRPLNIHRCPSDQPISRASGSAPRATSRSKAACIGQFSSISRWAAILSLPKKAERSAPHAAQERASCRSTTASHDHLDQVVGRRAG